jgi:large repetitive protein
MRKSFTLLLSTLILLSVFGFSSFAAAPQLVSTRPADEATNVKTSTTDLVVKFDQNVKFTTNGGTLIVWRGNTPLKSVALVSGNANAKIGADSLAVKHGLTLADNTTYSVTITNNAIENAAGEPFAGITAGNWVFTTGDYTVPVVDELWPADNAANVDVKADPFALEITFEDANNIQAVAGKKIWLYRADGTVVDIITINGTNPTVAGKTASIVINPNAFRDELTEYYVNVEAGAFTDLNGNKFAGISGKTAWTFSSRDYSAPFVTDATVTDISYDSATLNAAANEAGSIWFLVKKVSDVTALPAISLANGWVATETGAENAISVSFDEDYLGVGLDDGIKYAVYVVAENEENQVQPNAEVVEFTTLDNTAPLALDKALVNVNNVTVGVELTFNEEVKAGAGNLLIKRQSNNETVRTVPAADVLIEEDEDNDVWVMTASFDGLESGVGYYVTIPTGYIEDVAGNDYVSTFVTTTAWQFTSADFILPTVVVKLDESDPPLASDNILIDFSEEVKLVDGTSMAGLSTNAQWFDYIALEKNNVVVPFTASYSGSVITVNPTSNLDPNTTYVVKIRANAFEDLSDNAFSSVHTSYDIVTGDFGAATITYKPLNGASAVAQGTNPTIKFSKTALLSGTTASDISAANIKASITFKEDDASGDDVDFTVQWDAATRTITVVPDDALESEGVYYLSFDETDVEDVNGEDFTDPGSSIFTMIDYVPPTVTFSHTGTVDDLTAAADLTITFSEAVTLAGDVEDLVIFKENDIDGANLAFTATMTGNVITINPGADLVDGDTYYYGVGAGAASDGPNKNAAASSTFTFAPAVPDMVEVAEDGLVPAHEATGVKVNAGGDLVITITFTEAVKANPTMPSPSNATLYTSGGVLVDQVVIVAGDFEGDELTVTFEDVALTSEGEYYITIDEDVVVANANNAKTFAGIAANEWTFTAADVIKPVLSANTPLAGDVNVALNAPVVINVDDDVVVGTGNITIAAGTADVKTIAVANTVIDNTAGTITVPHAAFTQYNTVYTVTVPAGAYKDDAGNANDLFNTWTFTTAVNPAPAVVSLDPADEEDLVPAGTDEFVIEFSEEVQKGPAGSTAYLLELSGATRATLSGGVINAGTDILRGSILVENATAVQVAGTVVTLDFGFALVDGKEYFILIENGMFKDKSLPSNADFTGYNAYGTWNFYTKDVKAPTWEATYTERGEGMDVTSDIVITFSKPIEKATGAAIANADVANLFTLTVGGVPIAFTGNINADKTVVVLENASFIPALTTNNSSQAVVLAPIGIQGQVNEQDVTGTANFFVSDYDAPSVTLALDAVDGEEFSFDVESDEDGTIYWLVAEGDDTMTAEEVMAGTAIEGYETGAPETVTVDEDIVSETTYTVYAVAVDETGNVSDVETLEIETLDITKPLLVSKTNTFTSGGVLSLNFNENVVPNGATAVIRLAGTLEIIAVVPVTATASLDSLILTSAIALTYPDNQKFVIEIAGGVVEDGSGNTWDGIVGLGANAWTVGLADDTAPLFVGIDPDIDNTDGPVALNQVFTYKFNEPVRLTDNFLIEVRAYNYDGGPYNPANWDIYEVLEASNVTFSGNNAIINPTRDFLPRVDGTLSLVSRQYEIKILGNTFEDLSGNAYTPAITDVFYTVDNVAPVATFDPEDGEDEASVTAPLTITFSEAIKLLDGTVVDNYDLETMVYLTKDGEAVAHEATIDATAKIITITHANFEKGAEYTYGFTASFEDAAGNAVAADEATFTVVSDAVIATYIDFDPDNGDATEPTVVPVDQAFRIIFSGELFTYSTVPSGNNIAVTPTYLHGATAGTGAITLKQGATNVPFTASIESRTADETVIVVTPNSVLASETLYDLAVVANKLQLGVGNQTVLEDGESNDYMTEDSSAPTAVTFVPADGTTAPETGTLSVSFNEDVMAGTGTIEIRHEHGEVVLTIDAADLDIDDNLVKITALSELEAGNEYFVLIPSGVITDLSGNAWAGIDDEDEWNFIVSETLAAPQIVNIAPVGGNAPVNTSLVITFDRPVVLNGTEGFVAIYTTNGVAVQLIRVNDGAGLFTFNGDNTVVTVDINDLAQNTQYQVEVAAGTFVLEADNSLENEGVVRSIWTFTTEINEPPLIVSLTPEDDATSVSLRTVARMVFDINVQPGTGEIALRRGDDASVVKAFDVNSEDVTFTGRVVTFSLEGLLEADATDYYIIVPEGAITNISQAPEAFAGLEQMSSWNFTTQDDGVAPELVTWSPNDVEIEGNQPVFVMEFNENVMVVGSGNLVVTEVGATEPTLVIPITSEMVADAVITVSYDWRTIGTLKYGTEYFVTVDGGFIEDEWENIWEGVSDETAWTFMTEDLSVAIADVQGTGSASPMIGELVEVTGTITAIAPGEGFFMQDDNAAWSGIWVAYSNVSELAIGDGVVVEGTVDEVDEVTTISATIVEVVDAPLTVVAVVVDSPSSAKAEMYESVLVQVKGARANAANTSGVWSIYYETTDIVNVNKWFYTHMMHW